MDGIFIVIEGLDGAGSTTQIKKLSEYLKQKGYKVLTTKEPTNNIIGGLIRGQLTKDWNTGQECLQLLFSADRAHHLEKEITPALMDNYVVISDRYLFSTIAFGAIDVDYEWLKKINEKFRLPDLYFIIDTDPETCVERIKKSRRRVELFETVEKLKKVREYYLRLSKEYKNIYLIDGNKSIDEVFENIKIIINKKLSQKELTEYES